MSTDAPQSAMPTRQRTPRRRRWLRRVVVGFVLVWLLIGLSPRLLILSPWRDALLNRSLERSGMTVTTESASGGWFSSLRAEGIALRNDQNNVSLTADSVVLESNLYQLLRWASDLGTIEVEHPELTVNLPLAWQEPQAPREPPLLNAKLHDAGLTVNAPDLERPLLRFQGIDLEASIQAGDGQAGLANRILLVEPTVIFTRKTLSAEAIGQLQPWLAPSLDRPLSVEGQYSLRLEHFRCPLGAEPSELIDLVDLEATLELHEVALQTENPMLRLVHKTVCDQNGIAMPAESTISKNATIELSLRNGRLFQRGLAIGFPEVDPDLVVRSEGSIGWDRTLDLRFEIPRMDEAKQRARGPVRCQVTGTIDDPRCQVQDASLVIHVPEDQEPLLDLDGVDFEVHLEEGDDCQMLVFDPFTALDHEPVTPRLAATLLRRIDPELAQATELSGNVSLDIESLEVPITTEVSRLLPQFRLAGRLTVHGLTSANKSPARQLLANIVADQLNQPFGERLGEEAIRLVHDAEVDFEWVDGQLTYENLSFGFPDIREDLVIVSSGKIGIDETLDLQFEIPRLDAAKQAERGPIRCQVTGTVDDPHVRVEDASLVVHLPDRPEPLLDIDGVDMELHLEDDTHGKRIVAAPFAALDHEPITRRLASTLLKRVDPDLAQASGLSGEVSLQINTLELPLQGTAQQKLEGLKLAGRASIHQAASVAPTPSRRALLKVVADQLGKPQAALQGIEEGVQLIHESDVTFSLDQGRFRFSGLEVGLPALDEDLMIRCQGSVGLDESIDLRFDIPRLDEAKQRELGPIRCRVTGTASHPEIRVEDASLVVHLPQQAEPLLDIDGVDLEMKLKEEAGHSILVFSPFTALEHETITPQLAQTLLKRIDPGLAEAADVTGDISLEIESLELPTSTDPEALEEQLTFRGRLSVHELSSPIESPIYQALIKIAADQAGAEVAPGPTRLLRDVEIEFEYAAGRFQFRGLEVGFPDVSEALVVAISGSVGLDQSLDLTLSIPRLDPEKQAQLGPVQGSIGGTVQEPRISVQDASLVLRLPGQDSPILDIESVDLEFQFLADGDRRSLVAGPLTVLDKTKLTNELTGKLFQLVAPTLGELAEVEGQVSLVIDHLRVPLARGGDLDPQQYELQGKLQLHDLVTTAKTPLVSAMVKVLNDMYQKPPTERIRIAKDANVNFEFKEGRVYHRGLTLGFPDISPELVGSTEGSVGLDGSLDIELSVPRVLAGGNQDEDKHQPVRFQIKGTLQQPEVLELKE